MYTVSKANTISCLLLIPKGDLYVTIGKSFFCINFPIKINILPNFIA